jgi:hypothetical protein
MYKTRIESSGDMPQQVAETSLTSSYMGIPDDAPHFLLDTIRSMKSTMTSKYSPIIIPENGSAEVTEEANENIPSLFYRGNMILDIPVRPDILERVPHGIRDEFTHLRYSEVTCSPLDLDTNNFTLRTRLF